MSSPVLHCQTGLPTPSKHVWALMQIVLWWLCYPGENKKNGSAKGSSTNKVYDKQYEKTSG